MPYRYRRADDELIMDLVLSVPHLNPEQAAILEATQPEWYALNREEIERWQASDEGAE